MLGSKKKIDVNDSGTSKDATPGLNEMKIGFDAR
jgi:hypothetical protein